jgi:hypothetical protein
MKACNNVRSSLWAGSFTFSCLVTHNALNCPALAPTCPPPPPATRSPTCRSIELLPAGLDAATALTRLEVADCDLASLQGFNLEQLTGKWGTCRAAPRRAAPRLDLIQGPNAIITLLQLFWCSSGSLGNGAHTVASICKRVPAPPKRKSRRFSGPRDVLWRSYISCTYRTDMRIQTCLARHW